MIRDDSAFQTQDVIAASTNVAAVTAAAAEVSAGAMEKSDPRPSRKKEVNSDRIRLENRERKKRWREQNEDRNKDNDLRCRVNKRANKLFGKGYSEIKASWIEEEFGLRQLKRKEKERRRDPSGTDYLEPIPTPPKPSISLSERLVLHQQAQQLHSPTSQMSTTATTPTTTSSVQHQFQHHVDQQFHAVAAAHLAHPHFDSTTVKTALALNDLVKRNASHIDLAQLTGVLTDPNLARQLIEIEAQNNASSVVSSPTSTTSAMMMLPSPPVVATSALPIKPDFEMKSGTHVLEADYPMDAVLTLMQLNGSWKA